MRCEFVLASESPRHFAIRTTAGPTPFLYRYQLSGENGQTVVQLDAEIELLAAAAFMPQLARRLVKKGLDANLATLKHVSCRCTRATANREPQSSPSRSPRRSWVGTAIRYLGNGRP